MEYPFDLIFPHFEDESKRNIPAIYLRLKKLGLLPKSHLVPVEAQDYLHLESEPESEEEEEYSSHYESSDDSDDETQAKQKIHKVIEKRYLIWTLFYC
jgi:hypothetical protein